MLEFVISVISTVVGGLILTITLFFYNEIIDPKKNITGHWKVLIHVTKTDYLPYDGLEIEYDIYILQKGNIVEGNGEKVRENLKGKTTSFNGPARVRTDINGYLIRNILKGSKVYLNTTEFGKIRESSLIYQLKFKNKNQLNGSFFSSAGNSSGTAILEFILN